MRIEDWHTEDTITFLLIIATPAALCVGMAALIFRNLIAREYVKANNALKTNAFGAVLPLRIAAYERATLFLERLDPPSLIARCDPRDKSAHVLYTQLMAEINAEYEHNIIQQLYISEKCWNALNQARFDTVQTLSAALKKCSPFASGADFTEAVLQAMGEKEDMPVRQALKMLRDDVLSFFA